MAAEVNMNMRFKVLYKFPKQKQVTMDYSAPTLASLMRSLQLSEGVNRGTVEFLYIHQHMPDGKVKEVIAIDPQQPKAVNDEDILDAPFSLVDKDEDEFQRDASILNNVTQLLTRASKSRIILKARTPKRVKGFHFSAIAAKPKETLNYG